MDRLLLAFGVAAGPLFTLAYLVTGAVRPHYRPLRHPVSSLSLGGSGWTQTVNFVGTGLLTLGFAVGLWQAGQSRPGAVLVGVFAAGLLCAGIFRTDPVSGYPPGTPDQLRQHTRAGYLHDLLSLFGFIALAAACFVFAGSGSSAWTAYSIASGVLFAATMVLSSIAFAQVKSLVGFGGLCQRVSITIAWGWLTVLALQTLSAG